MIYNFCVKCGTYGLVRRHHSKGYATDTTQLYCVSCDSKAHNKARTLGKCKLSSKESKRASKNSYSRTTYKTITLSNDTIGANVRLFENISLNKNTNNMVIASYFQGTNNFKLPEVILL